MKSSDPFFALRPVATHMVRRFSFAQTANAMDEPEIRALIVEAMDASSLMFMLSKDSLLFRITLFSLPPWLAVTASPETAGLNDLQVLLGTQVNESATDPRSLGYEPHPITYHRLLDEGPA